MLRNTQQVLSAWSALANMAFITTLSATITYLGLAIATVIAQVKAHFASTNQQLLAAVAPSIYTATPLNGVSIVGVVSSTPFAAAGPQDGWIVTTVTGADWLRLLNHTGSNGDAITITRTDPAVIIVKNW